MIQRSLGRASKSAESRTRQTRRPPLNSGRTRSGSISTPGASAAYPFAAAREWIAELPPEIVKIAVVVDADWDEAVALAALPGITALQLHGRETPEFCQRLAERGIQFIKALPVTTAEAASQGTLVFHKGPSCSIRRTRGNSEEAAGHFRGKLLENLSQKTPISA